MTSSALKIYGKRTLKRATKKDQKKNHFISILLKDSLELIKFDQVNLKSGVELGTKILEQESS